MNKIREEAKENKTFYSFALAILTNEKKELSTQRTEKNSHRHTHAYVFCKTFEIKINETLVKPSTRKITKQSTMAADEKEKLFS